MDNIFRQIHIENCKYVNKGGCATVYRLNEDKIVKVFDRGSTLAMIEREYDYSKRAYEHGIPTAKPYEIVVLITVLFLSSSGGRDFHPLLKITLKKYLK